MTPDPPAPDPAPRTATRHPDLPSPPAWPLVGHALAMGRDPVGFLATATRAHGDLVGLRLGRRRVVVLSHPADARHVLREAHARYGKASRGYRRLRAILGDGLVTAEGRHWSRQRRLLNPLFRPSRFADLPSMVAAALQPTLRSWSAAAAAGTPVDIERSMSDVTLRVVGAALLGEDVSSQLETIGAAVPILLRHVNDGVYNVNPLADWLPTASNRAAARARADLFRVVDEVIATRQKERPPAAPPTPPPNDTTPPDDLLTRLLEVRDPDTGEGLTPQQIRDEVLTIMLAGHETTATALTWTWFLLGRFPAVRRRLQAELRAAGDTPEDRAAAPYLDQVLSESMRLYPPAWLISRAAEEDDDLGRALVPAGAVVLVCPFLAHRHPDFWTDPEGFDPDRWAEDSAERGPREGAFMPFGLGPRACIGDHFARREAALVLASLVPRFHVELRPGATATPRAMVTLRPREGLIAKVRSPS